MTLAARIIAALAIPALLTVAPPLAVAQTNPPPPGPTPSVAPPNPAALGPPPPLNIIDEIKIGALAHDVGFLTHHVEKGADANLEILFTAPDLLSIIGSPRPHIGADINTAGNTSDGYFGLTWGATLLRGLFTAADGIFVTGSLGGAVQDGFTGGAHSVPPPGRKLLGSAVLFRESAELGYQITPTISVSALLDHISNANLAPRNAGITSAGARFGFKF